MSQPAMDKTASPSLPESRGRLQAIDFTKGALVIFMVIYHALNYSTQLELGFRYLAFLPPSFIFITGFLIAFVYFPRPRGRDAATSGRMVVRGLKLLVLFTVLNVLGTLVSTRNYNGQPMHLKSFFAHWQEIYFSGAGTMAAFEVLLPIAYILLLGPLLLWLSRQGRWTVPALAVLTIPVLAGLEANRSGVPVNAAMMSAGLLGAALGLLPQASFDQLGRWWVVPPVLYAILAGLAHDRMGERFLLQLSAATLSVAALFGIGARFQKTAWLMDRFTMLGNYSLLAYIVQIAFLQILVRLLGRPEPASLDFLLLLSATLLVTVLAAELTDWLRTASSWVDRAYRLVFA
jgi:peptidoglycan/LPS O-acetylase OafA/YrhL